MLKPYIVLVRRDNDPARIWGSYITLREAAKEVKRLMHLGYADAWYERER